MKQVLIKKGNVTVEEVPAPALDENSVLVETAYSLISAGTEVSTVAASKKSLARQALEQPRRILTAVEMARQQGVGRTLATIRGLAGSAAPSGYSCSGVVLEVGANVRDLRPGMRVACAGAGRANHAELVAVPGNLT